MIKKRLFVSCIQNIVVNILSYQCLKLGRPKLNLKYFICKMIWLYMSHPCNSGSRIQTLENSSVKVSNFLDKNRVRSAQENSVLFTKAFCWTLIRLVIVSRTKLHTYLNICQSNLISAIERIYRVFSIQLMSGISSNT